MNRPTFSLLATLAVFCALPCFAWAGDPPALVTARAASAPASAKKPAPATAEAPDPLLPAPTRDTDSTLIWKAGERLTWADFRGQAGATDPLHALTSSDLDVQVSCTDDRLTVAVQAVFRPLESWSKARDSAPLLRHEQVHFDLTEVHARLLRHTLLRSAMTCDQARTNLRPLIDASFKAWQLEQDRYDEETNHGLDTKAQAQWETNVRALLAKMPGQ